MIWLKWNLPLASLSFCIITRGSLLQNFEFYHGTLILHGDFDSPSTLIFRWFALQFWNRWAVQKRSVASRASRVPGSFCVWIFSFQSQFQVFFSFSSHSSGPRAKEDRVPVSSEAQAVFETHKEIVVMLSISCPEVHFLFSSFDPSKNKR